MDTSMERMYSACNATSKDADRRFSYWAMGTAEQDTDLIWEIFCCNSFLVDNVCRILIYFRGCFHLKRTEARPKIAIHSEMKGYEQWAEHRFEDNPSVIEAEVGILYMKGYV